MINRSLISVIIVTHQRPQTLDFCLKSLLQQKSVSEFELLVVLNGPDEASAKFLRQQNIEFIALEKRMTPAGARNLAAQKSQCKWLLFLDDDVILPRDYFKKALPHLEKRIEILGGPDQTPPEADEFEQALGLALSSPLATAHTHKRHYKGKGNEEGNEGKFILCHLWILRETFLSAFFDERFFRNEENVLLHVLKDKPMLYSPDLFVYHQRKANFFKLSPAVFSSGRHRMRSFFLYPDSFKPLYLVPLFFVFYLLSLIFLSQIWALLPLVVFFLLSLFFAFKRGGFSLGPMILSYQIFINLSYALGSFYGILESLIFYKQLRRKL